MVDTPQGAENGISQDPVLVAMQGLREVVDSKLDGIRQEQDGLRDWMGRMSSSIERLAETVTRQVNIETRLAHVEGTQSDHTLDIKENAAQIDLLKEKRTRTQVILSGISASVGAAAVILFKKAFGVE